jgi:hypothetical protein
MCIPSADLSYRAVSMELVAYLDARHVEMNILTDTGATLSIICPRDSIFAVQKHIEEMGQACPEIATWSNQYRAELMRRGPYRVLPTRSGVAQPASNAHASH